ncbi:MAG: hypothetical protein WCF84_18105 [Anaerolineae bacterium]
MKHTFILLLVLVLATACSNTQPTGVPVTAATAAAQARTDVASTIVPTPAAGATKAALPVTQTPAILTTPPVSGTIAPEPVANPAANVANALLSLGTVHSFRAHEVLVNSQGTISTTFEMISPDRMREISQGPGFENQVVVIGKVAYSRTGATPWQKLGAPLSNPPSAAFGVLSTTPDLLRFTSMTKDFALVGQETLDGIPTRVYQYTITAPDTQTTGVQKLWVNADGLPYKLQTESNSGPNGSKVTVTITYDYKATDIQITPPIP